MNINNFKKFVYQFINTKNTKELKKVKPDLVKGKDLRKKSSWISIYNALKLINDFQEEQITNNIRDNYGFQELNINSSLSEILNSIKAVSKLNEDIEESLILLEQKSLKNKI
ncbi:hypothetical protein [Geminocystis sp.]|uniref:hypothetical protein n=1 Tax=Geminocystis sp. TaxID=2664100 RepID=UPI0035931A54